MTYTHLICISIYFIINSFLAGKNWDEYEDWRTEVLAALLIFAFGFPIGCSIWVWDKTTWFAGYIQLVTWWKFYIKKDFDNLEKKTLEVIEDLCRDRFNTDSFKDRAYRYWARKIYKRNNHKPQE